MILHQHIREVSRSRPWKTFTIALNQHRNHNLWATKQPPKTAINLALDYYDTVYSPFFENRWPSIRLALLCPHKYCAVVNNHCDYDAICTELQNAGAVNIREMFNVYKDSLLTKNKIVMRRKELDNIYYLDRKIEEIADRKRKEEMENIYPEGESYLGNLNETNSNKAEEASKEDLLKQAKTPLEQSLAEASIDMNRQIDPSEGLSSVRLNDFVPVSKMKGKEGFVSEAEHFSFYNETGDFPVTVEREGVLNFPSHLQIYTFGPGDISSFRSPKSGVSGVHDYYLMDAGSILPVLALGLKPGDTVLDMCAAPGGKSLLCLQTLYPDSIVCNDTSLSRLNRLRYVMSQYLNDWKDKVTISNRNGVAIQEPGVFSKILVDVPCTTDRHSATEVENNIFKPSRNKERILLPQLQMELLFNALKLVKEGGTVVYSTCTLNPAQNDGVVHMALRKIWEETNMKIVVKDLTNVLEPTKAVFKYADPKCLRYGSLVVPYLPLNFGPMYFCKMVKKSN